MCKAGFSVAWTGHAAHRLQVRQCPVIVDFVQYLYSCVCVLRQPESSELPALMWIEEIAISRADVVQRCYAGTARSEEHTSELQSLMRISYAVFCLKKKNTYT